MKNAFKSIKTALTSCGKYTIRRNRNRDSEGLSLGIEVVLVNPKSPLRTPTEQEPLINNQHNTETEIEPVDTDQPSSSSNQQSGLADSASKGLSRGQSRLDASIEEWNQSRFTLMTEKIDDNNRPTLESKENAPVILTDQDYQIFQSILDPEEAIAVVNRKDYDFIVDFSKTPVHPDEPTVVGVNGKVYAKQRVILSLDAARKIITEDDEINDVLNASDQYVTRLNNKVKEFDEQIIKVQADLTKLKESELEKIQLELDEKIQTAKKNLNDIHIASLEKRLEIVQTQLDKIHASAPGGNNNNNDEGTSSKTGGNTTGEGTSSKTGGNNNTGEGTSNNNTGEGTSNDNTGEGNSSNDNTWYHLLKKLFKATFGRTSAGIAVSATGAAGLKTLKLIGTISLVSKKIVVDCDESAEQIKKCQQDGKISEEECKAYVEALRIFRVRAIEIDTNFAVDTTTVPVKQVLIALLTSQDHYIKELRNIYATVGQIKSALSENYHGLPPMDDAFIQKRDELVEDCRNNSIADYNRFKVITKESPKDPPPGSRSRSGSIRFGFGSFRFYSGIKSLKLISIIYYLALYIIKNLLLRIYY